MDFSTCLVIAKCYQSKDSLIVYHSFKCVVNHIVHLSLFLSKDQQTVSSSYSTILLEKEEEKEREKETKLKRNELTQWVSCIQYYNLEIFIKSDDTFYSFILLIAAYSPQWSDTDRQSLVSLLSKETTKNIIGKYLPRILGQQSRILTIFEWKFLRNLSLYFSFPRTLQRSVMSLINETILWYLDQFSVENISDIDASAIYTIENAVHILFSFREIDSGNITSICQNNVHSLILFVMTLEGHHFDNDKGKEGEGVDTDAIDPLSPHQMQTRRKRPKSSKTRQQTCVQLWKETLSQNLSSFITSCLMNQMTNELLPSQSPFVGLSLDETFSLFQSSHKSLQLISLALLYHYVNNDLQSLSSSLPESSQAPLSPSVTPVVSALRVIKKIPSKTIPSRGVKPVEKDQEKSKKYSKKTMKESSSEKGNTSSQRQRVPQTMIEICRSGYLRQLCWCLVHSQSVIRSLAYQIMHVIHQICLSSPSAEKIDSIHSTSSPSTISVRNLFTVSCIEQGLISVLEWIANGVPVYYRNRLSSGEKTSTHQSTYSFPEPRISQWSREILLFLQTDVETNSSLFTSRLQLAVLYTNSSRLRCNIFTGLYLLSSSSPVLTQWILNGTEVRSDEKEEGENNSDCLFSKVLREIRSHETHSTFYHLKDLLSLIFHLLLSVYHALLRSHHTFSECHQTVSSSSVYSSDSLIVMILDDTSPVPNTYVKMSCPSLNVISQHTSILANEILNAKLIETNPVIAEATYSVWQEIFSHMSDEYILQSAGSTLSLEMLLDLYCVSQLYEMKSLQKAYTTFLLKKMNKKNSVQILQVLLSEGILQRQNDYTIYLRLLLPCIFNLIDALKLILNTGDGRQLLILQDIVSQLFILPMKC